MVLSKTFNALSDPSRQKILELLKKGDLAAGAIGEYFKFTAPTLSHHLGVLKDADLISVRRDGQMQIYSLNLSVFEEVAEKVIKFFKK
ncbi:MAG: autorepressor SdpR family transcription factor [Patescibacteria group bacterium]|nr:autorepressor SdpR family transcription factor [Patescibacteria group bacterium]